MMKRNTFLIGTAINTMMIVLMFVTAFQTANAQQPPAIPLSQEDQQIINQLKTDLDILADDKMEGRETGTKGEEMAGNYIESRFKRIALIPKGDNNTYFQLFDFTAKKFLGDNNRLTLNNQNFKLNETYYPLSYSSNSTVEGEVVKVGFGISAEALAHDDYQGKEAGLKDKVFLIELSSPDGVHPHSKYLAHSDIKKKIELAISKGAAAIIFVNSDKNLDNPDQKLSTKITPVAIPVLFAQAEAASFLLDAPEVKAKISVEILKDSRTGKNLIGWIDNNAPNTVVIGAHYDHLGWGENNAEGNEALERAIHNGADDNASGTAALIELAAYFKKSDKKNNNYLFIAFSGEEKGLLGSNYFVKNPTIDMSHITYMINMDEVGRLDSEKNTVLVMGYGTSPQWEGAFAKAKEKSSLIVKTSDNTAGSSDQTSFYLHDIPVLHFFSGTHPDYHKPTDDKEKINFEGMFAIVQLIEGVVEELDGSPKLEFTKVKSVERPEGKRPTVTLGIIPDFMSEAEGMAIDGATEGKPGHAAGLKAGDVIQKIGDSSVSDMGSYMKALQYFKAGDKTKVLIKRGEEQIEVEVQF